MGLQVRKRTKGSKGWWNGSYSKKGAGVSGSVKVASNVTYNTGDLLNGKTGSRLTINLGNGIRYVSYGKKKSPRRSTKNQPPHQSTGTLTMIGSLVKFVLALFVAFLVLTIFAGLIINLVGV